MEYGVRVQRSRAFVEARCLLACQLGGLVVCLLALFAGLVCVFTCFAFLLVFCPSACLLAGLFLGGLGPFGCELWRPGRGTS